MGILGNRGKKRRRADDLAGTSKPQEPCCGVCGLTARGVARRTKRKDPNALIVGNLVGLCPTCRSVYCNEHALAHAESECCPACRTQLDFTWDQVERDEPRIRMSAPIANEG